MKMEAKPNVAIVARPRMLATAVVVSKAMVTMLMIVLGLPVVADACGLFVSFDGIILHSILLNGGIRFPIWRHASAWALSAGEKSGASCLRSACQLDRE